MRVSVQGALSCHPEPFAFVTLSETKGLISGLRVNSVRDL